MCPTALTLNRFAGFDVQSSNEVEQCCKSGVIYEIFGQVKAAAFGSCGFNHRLLALQGVPDQESLEERLLCVETSEASVKVAKAVIEVVASIATFVSFLPLGNRVP